MTQDAYFQVSIIFLLFHTQFGLFFIHVLAQPHFHVRSGPGQPPPPLTAHESRFRGGNNNILNQGTILSYISCFYSKLFFWELLLTIKLPSKL